MVSTSVSPRDFVTIVLSVGDVTFVAGLLVACSVGCSHSDLPTAYSSGDPGSAPLSNLSSYPGAVCLDGTPGAYYHLKGNGSGVNKWYAEPSVHRVLL
jgi:hypothetical protein